MFIIFLILIFGKFWKNSEKTYYESSSNSKFGHCSVNFNKALVEILSEEKYNFLSLLVCCDNAKITLSSVTIQPLKFK